jgi:hypothetical protein
MYDLKGGQIFACNNLNVLKRIAHNQLDVLANNKCIRFSLDKWGKFEDENIRLLRIEI